MHTVTLFIPALFWPHPGVDCDAPLVPILQTLIGRGDVSSAPCDDEQAWLCGQFGVARQIDWPVAPIALLGNGTLPEDDFWFSADPVHLQVNRNQLILLAPEALSVTQAEADSLCAALNRHFAADEFVFMAPQPHRWYLKTVRPVRVRTRGLSQVVGQDVDRLLTEGEDRMAWHRIFNEVQMLLHAHPVNEDREQRGALPINSVWFSGGGILPPAHASFQAVIGSSALVRGLSKLANVPLIATLDDVSEKTATEVLIALDDAATAAMRVDPLAWKVALEDLERAWVAPLKGMLKKGRIRRLAIATFANGRGYQWSLGRMNLWRLWKPAGTLAVPVSAP